MRAREISESLGKLPPQAIELEESVVGAMLLERDALDVLDFLQRDDFYKEAHGEVFEAIHILFVAGSPVDMRTVVNQLKKTGKLELVGGMHFIAELSTKVSQSVNIEAHARIIREMAIKRNLIRLSSMIQSLAYEDTTDAFELMDRLQTELVGDGLAAPNKSGKTPSQEYVAFVERLKHRKDKDVTGVRSGFVKIDSLTAGWQPSTLIIIAARPGMGKTAFMLACAENAGVPVDIYSLEMSAEELTERRVSSAYELDNYNLKRGNVSDLEWTKLSNDPAKISSKPVWIDDTAGLSITELRIRAIRNKKKHGTGLIIVDYLQLMRGTGGNREQEISSISRGLKALAKDLQIPVIALSQLSRAVETRGGDKRPQLSDLRESGAIEQDADIVSFLYRPEYYGITVDEGGLPTAGKAEFIISKHRGGSTEAVWIDFIAKYTKFLEMRDFQVEREQWSPFKDSDNDDNPFR
jgi:replicative DNA helicase